MRVTEEETVLDQNDPRRPKIKAGVVEEQLVGEDEKIQDLGLQSGLTTRFYEVNSPANPQKS